MKLDKLTKGQQRKYGAMLKSVNGDEKAAQQMFQIWMDAQPQKASGPAIDPVAETLKEIVDKHLPKDIRLGNRGYTIKKAKGKGASGFVALKNE